MRLTCAFALLLLVGCDCAGPVEGCTSDSMCSAEEMCQDEMCVPRPDAGGPRDGGGGGDDAAMCPGAQLCSGGTVCCADTEECVDGFQCLPVCEETRCGDNQMLCCAAGQVCVDGVVCAAECAAEETLCGVDFEICCGMGDVCLDDVCVTPGEVCADDFDCRDGALYCEPTIARCLTTPTDVMCEVRPDFEQIELTQEWHWSGVDVGGSNWLQVIDSPVVGDVSGDGIPDVIVPAYTSTAWNDPILVGLSGDDGSLLFAIPRDSATTSAEGEGVVVADFDPTDAALEIVYRLDSGGIRMVDGDGVTELGLRVGLNARGQIEVADFDHDGVPDVVVGCRVYNGRDISDASMDIIAGGGCPSGGWEAPVVADLDGDGEVELTNGITALNHDGSVLWAGGPSGNVAIVDFDVDGMPEIVNVGGGQIRLQDGLTGAILIGPGGSVVDGTFLLPGGGTGGPPTVADFDGDGLPEFASAGRGAYAVYDPDCLSPPARLGGDTCPTDNLLRWQAPTQDFSSSVTGSSVFDFQGDGVAEVVYNDECFLHVYDGRDGTELLVPPIPNSSRTGYEYPIVVDVDGDGNSEIVVVANNDQAVVRDNCPASYAAAFGVPVGSLPPEYARGTAGVFVYGDAFDRWVPTRPIWNQYSYHVTNVLASGAVPTTEADNWSTPGLNNYRQNVQGRGIFNAPDLEVTLEAAGMCAGRSLALSAVVRNAGSRGVAAGVPVEFVRTDVTPEVVVATAMTTVALLPGQTERITVTVSDIPVDTDLTFEVRVDTPSASAPSGVAIECDEDDNTAAAAERCPGLE